ncbi:TPA: tyrosine-type recombinase/integrase [Serratia marcescens]|nr:tyrosine-type recombinase/integrase [Serratia marcescens]
MNLVELLLAHVDESDAPALFQRASIRVRSQVIVIESGLLSADIRKNSPDGSLHPDGLTKGFVKARNNSGIPLSENPPTFHEIRSLAGRMYEKEYGKEFTQKLLGHTSEKMTQKYLDTRRKEFILL